MNVKPRTEFSDGQGYVNSVVLRENSGNRERLHRVIVMGVVGRKLSSSVIVHHVDDDGTNNRHDNLVVLENQGEHARLHYRRSVLRAGGDPFTDALCDLCHHVHPMADCYRLKANRTWRGRGCHRDYMRAHTRKHKDIINARARERRLVARNR